MFQLLPHWWFADSQVLASNILHVPCEPGVAYAVTAVQRHERWASSAGATRGTRPLVVHTYVLHESIDY